MVYDATLPEWEVHDILPGNQDKDLFESAAVECNDIYGFVVDYYASNMRSTAASAQADQLYGENQTEGFLGPFTTKVRYNPSSEGAVADIFGITNINPIQFFYIPRYTFTRDIPSGVATEPIAGDLLYLHWNQRIYEITSIYGRDEIFMAQNDLIYSMGAKQYRLRNVDEIPGTTINVDDLTDAVPLSAWGDNAFIEEQSELIDSYDELPNINDLYGFN